jgi:hypothetical protein
MTRQTLISRCLSWFIAAVIAALTATSFATAQSPTDAQIRRLLIDKTKAEYNATGRPCGCPLNFAMDGKVCGLRSANSRRRPDGPMPKCEPEDVSDKDIEVYRSVSRVCGSATDNLTWEEIVRLSRVMLVQSAKNMQVRAGVCPPDWGQRLMLN